jgi:hypothetical protein
MSKTYVIEMVETKVVDKVTCNKCGKSDENVFIDLSPIEIIFGYGSKRDGEFIQFDLYAECIEEFISTFKVPVETMNLEESESDNADAE